MTVNLEVILRVLAAGNLGLFFLVAFCDALLADIPQQIP